MDISAEIAAIQAASQGSELRQPLVGALNKLNTGSLPAVTASDAGKILKVGANGWEVGEKSGYMPVPTATKQITENGTYDVSNFANAVVSVSGGGGGEYAQIQIRDFAKFNAYSGTDARNCVITPYLFDENTGIETEFMLTTVRAWQAIYGTWDTASSGNITWNRATADANAAGPLYIGNGTLSGQNGMQVPNMFNTKHKIITNISGHSYVDDSIEYPYTPINPGRSIPIVIGGNYLTSQHDTFSGRIYSFKIFNRSTDVQVANIYPASIIINNSDTPIDVLYDSINNLFFIGGSTFYCDDE